MKRASIVLIGFLVAVVAFAGGEKKAAVGKTYDRSLPKVVQLDEPVQTGSSLVVGTIQYDTGVVTSTPGAGLIDFMVGNRFDTATGGAVLASGSVTEVQFYLNTIGGTGAYVSVYGPVNGTTAPKLTSALFAGLGTGFNTVSFAPGLNYTGSSFLAGVWMNSTTGDIVGIDSNLGTQGAHGVAIDDNYPATFGTAFQTIGSVNAIVRSTGDILVPVELMSFSLE